MSFIKIADLSKHYGHFQALKGIDLEIQKGEVIVVLGPSGSGKSTLIRCVNALESISGGKIEVDGVDVHARSEILDALRREIGFVFQQFNLYPHMTVAENIMLAPIQVRKMKKEDARQLAVKLLKRVEIESQADKHPGQLSGGQQQRVAIARALAMQPKIMLFDEPTSALDAEMIREVLDVMVKLAGEGMTMIVVTHELGFARKVADRIVFMEAGEIVEISKPDVFFEAPADPRSQRFLSQVLAA